MGKLRVKQVQGKGFVIDQPHGFIAAIQLIQELDHFFGGVVFVEIEAVFAVGDAVVLHGGFGGGWGEDFGLQFAASHFHFVREAFAECADVVFAGAIGGGKRGDVIACARHINKVHIGVVFYQCAGNIQREIISKTGAFF